MSSTIVQEKIEAACLEVEKGTNFEVLAEMKAILNSVYGEERNQIAKPTYFSVNRMLSHAGQWQSAERNIPVLNSSGIASFLRTQAQDCLSYQILIHFPEITIKNDKNEHLIRNIYVRLFLRPTGTLSSYLQGMRTTVTEAEFVSQYLHSHLPRLNPNLITFQTFCTGIGEINQVLALLNAKYTSANFMVLLMHIKNYLEWESKEGHPYMFMDNVFTRNDRLNTYNPMPETMADRSADTIIDQMKRELNVSEVMEMVRFDVTERGITAQSTLGFEKWMASRIERWNTEVRFGSGYRNSLFLSVRDNAGQYYMMPESSSRRIVYENGPILNFKGTDIKFEVIERSQTQTHEIYANPKITKETCKKLSRIISKAALNSAGIKSGSSLVYNS